MTQIEIDQTVIANHRKPISIIGGTLGTQYQTAEARTAWPDFDKQKLEIENSGNVGLILNRAPRRYRMVGHDIVSVQLGKDATGANKVYINKDMDGEISIPVAPNMEKVGEVNDNALGEALRGNKDIFFANGRKLADTLNGYNNDEKRRLIGLRQNIDKMIQQIDSAIVENNKKAEIYERELVESTPSHDPTNTGVTIVVKED